MNETNEPTSPSTSLLEITVASSIGALLRKPADLVAALLRPKSATLAAAFFAFAMIALAAYGALVGSLTGGRQVFAAAVKIPIGAAASILICLPSLFIFACLTGADVSWRTIAGVASAMVALTSLLLIGFAPIAWIFSQSTESVAFIGFLHISFWIIGLSFGLKIPGLLMQTLHITDRLHVRVWSLIFVVVTLQMTTALRPIIGTSEHWLPNEKKFFATHWLETIAHDARADEVRDARD